MIFIIYKVMYLTYNKNIKKKNKIKLKSNEI